MNTPRANPPPWSYDPAELADLYAAGMLSPLEQLELDARIAARDPDIRRELARIAPVVETLLAADPVQPSAGALERIERAIARQSPQATPWAADERGMGHTAAAAVFVHHASRGRWRRSGLPGVWVQRLYSDRMADRLTMLVKCEPGALIPEHEHEGLEELIVLEGELSVGDILLKAGDYFRALAGAEHGELRSPSGCICLLFTGYGTLSARSKLAMAWEAMFHWVRPRLGG